MYFEHQEKEQARDAEQASDDGKTKSSAERKIQTQTVPLSCVLASGTTECEWREVRNADGFTAAEVCPAHQHEEDEERAMRAAERVVHHEYMDHRGTAACGPTVSYYILDRHASLSSWAPRCARTGRIRQVRRFVRGTYRPPTSFNPWTVWWDNGSEAGAGTKSKSGTTATLTKGHVHTHSGCRSTSSLPKSSFPTGKSSAYLSAGARLTELKRLETIAILAEEAECDASSLVESAEVKLRAMQLAHDDEIAALKRTEENAQLRQVDRYQAKMQRRKLQAVAALPAEEEEFRRREGKWFPGSPDTQGLQEARLLRKARENERVAQRDAERNAASDTIDAFEEQERQRKRRERAE